MGNDELTSIHIVVYALSLLGGAHQKIHTEHIAQKCLEIAPDRFKWEHYKYPDKELVRKALFHASEQKNGSLVTGRSGIEQYGKSRDGWQLSPAGAAWLKQNEQSLKASVGSIIDVVPKREAERFLKKIRGETAYRTYSERHTLEGVSPYMFTDLLNCSPDAPRETIQIKFNRLLSTAELVGDKEVLNFLRTCEAQFSDLFPPRQPSSHEQLGGVK